MKSDKKIGIIDFGGQYAHLIASRIRRSGAFSEILSNEEPMDRYREFSGLILSGGPSSVYASQSPQLPLGFFELPLPILGICYGHQLLMHALGGKVLPAKTSEYGPAPLHLTGTSSLLSKQMNSGKTVWMSHGDEVESIPSGFKTIATSPDCKHAFVADDSSMRFGIQFHPEVTHSEEGAILLQNFIALCGATSSWDMDRFISEKKQTLQKNIPKNKKVFLLVSGGVDSLVAYVLLAKVIGKERLKGLLIDTGFMREKEIENLKLSLKNLQLDVNVWDARNSFYSALEGKKEPEEKRRIVGDQFLKEQEKAINDLGLNPEEWILGQGTIYPDTIESGGTKHSHKIKTHHNRVPKIQELLDKGLVVEPISDLYKDEVRELGRKLGLPEEMVSRHPFPGPGLVVRMIASEKFLEPFPKDSIQEILTALDQANLPFQLMPIRSVGVQGDQRSYAQCLVFQDAGLSWESWERLASQCINQEKRVNRAAILLEEPDFPEEFVYKPMDLSETEANTLRRADAIVTQFLQENHLMDKIWQMPVVLLPFGSKEKPRSIVLRPVESQEAMTANFFRFPKQDLLALTALLKQVEGIRYVFYDITNKPPGTIEWE